MRVLVVEDERQLADAIAARAARARAWPSTSPTTAQRALRTRRVTGYDVVVLDRDLPGDARRRRVPRGSSPTAPTTRVLMLTAAGDARRPGRRAVARRRRLPGQAVRVRRAGRPGAGARPARRARRARRCCDARRHRARPGPPRRRPRRAAGRADPQGVRRARGAAGAPTGAVVSAEELLERVWDENADPFTNTVRVTVMTLRRKLGEPPVIETVRRRGLPGLSATPRACRAGDGPAPADPAVRRPALRCGASCCWPSSYVLVATT